MNSVKSEIAEKLKCVERSGVNFSYNPEYDPDNEFAGIKALTLESAPYGGKKTKVFGYFGMPETSDGKKVPAVLLLHGGGGHAYACWVKLWNDRGFAALAIDTTGYMPRKRNAGSREGGGDEDYWERALGSFYEDGYTLPPDNDHFESFAKPIEEQWMYNALAAAVKANTFLRNDNRINSSQIGVVGISWGGIMTSILIGYDLRFSFAAAVYGSGYLSKGVTDFNNIFKPRPVIEQWAAEDNFDKVKIPVLWLGWNDDSNFSVMSNSLSYSATAANNKDTRLVLKDKLLHNHRRGWSSEEIYTFAQSVIGRSPRLPEIISQPRGRSFSFEVECEDGVTLTGAKAYYITAPMTCVVSDKYNCGERSYMSEDWKIRPCDLSGNRVIGSLPEECYAYYVELSFKIGKIDMVTASEYVTVGASCEDNKKA